MTHESADYVCIHEVDYLPIWADYSWSAKPARLAWHGLVLREDWNSFFGAVVLFDNAAFERVNGFPNCYRGWGPEDLELGQRCILSGLGFDRRDGTYISLPHKHAGFSAPGIWTDVARQTHAVFHKRQPNLAALMPEDGLSSLKFDLVEKKPLKLGDRSFPDCWHYVVDVGAPEN